MPIRIVLSVVAVVNLHDVVRRKGENRVMQEVTAAMRPLVRSVQSRRRLLKY
jgi:hypothetical protein